MGKENIVLLTRLEGRNLLSLLTSAVFGNFFYITLLVAASLMTGSCSSDFIVSPRGYIVHCSNSIAHLECSLAPRINFVH